MKQPRLPENETQRLHALRRYGLLDTDPESIFNEFVELVARALNVPVALISLVDMDRQWFKARFGIDTKQTPRAISFCGHVVAEGLPLIVEDTLADVRFADNPLVLGDPKIRFYAGAPLITPEGYVLGSFCVIDQEPRTLSAERIETLSAFARQVMRIFELRRQSLIASTYRRLFETAESFAAIVSEAGAILEINAVWEQRLGYTSEELAAFGWEKLLALEDVPTVHSHLQIARTGEPVAFDIRMLNKDGSARCVSWNLTFDAIQGVIYCIGHDITERVEALAEANELTRLFDVSLDLLSVADANGRFRKVNPAFSRVLGYSAGELTSRSTLALVHPDDIEATLEETSRLQQGKPVTNFENRFRSKGGEWRWLAWRAVPHSDAVYAVARDVTQQKEQAEELNRYKNALRLLHEVSIQRYNDVVALIVAHLKAGRAIFELDTGVVMRLTGNRHDVMAISTSEAVHANRTATEYEVSWCQRVLAEQKTLAYPDVEPSSQARKDPATGSFVNAFLGTPILIHGEIAGTLTFSSTTAPQRTFPAYQLEVIELLARTIGHALEEQKIAEERARAEQRDARAREEMDRMKREFVSVVSHELRTPLTSIRGALGLALGGVAGPVAGELKDLLDLAHANTERLIRLTNDILDLERLESGVLVLNRTELDVAEVVEEASAALRPLALEHRVALKNNVQEGLVIRADKDRIVQVITNLMANAIKFSPLESQVEVKADRSFGNVRVSVTDQGSGVPAEKRGLLFKKFQQLDSTDSRQKSGSGLGLAICKALIEQHGGIVGFERPETGGSRFFFEIPEQLDSIKLAFTRPAIFEVGGERDGRGQE